MGRRSRRAGPYRVADDEEDEPRVTARSKAIDAQLARLMGDGRLRSAALVGDKFGLDPVVVLEEPDSFKVLVRIAALNYLQNEAEKAARRGRK